VGPQTGVHLLAIVHSYNFNSAEQLAYLVLIPIKRQSGSSVRGRARLSKAGPPKIRVILYMAAIVATKYNPHVKVLYDRLVAKGKAKMAAIGSAMRKLVHLCFGVLKNRITLPGGLCKNLLTSKTVSKGLSKFSGATSSHASRNPLHFIQATGWRVWHF
jgi:hypothetical protein